MFGQGRVQGKTSYVLHSLSLCEALTHRLARHTSPCLGAGFAAVFAVRAGGAEKGSSMGDKGSIDRAGLIRRSGSSIVHPSNESKDEDDNDDVFWFEGNSNDATSTTAEHRVPQAVEGAVASTAQSWRIMRRLVAEVQYS